MPDAANPRARPAPMPTLRALSALLFASTLVLGYLGFHQYLPHHRNYPHTAPDIIYYILQLFFMGADPLQDGGSVPFALQIARYTAPATTLTALIETGRLLLADRLRRLRTRHRHGHAVVCGDSSAARALVLRLRAAGRQVVLVRQQPVEPPELLPRDLLAVAGDARDPDVLRGAGVQRAGTLYAATSDSAANVAIAVAASRLTREGGQPIAVYAQIHDPELCVSLQARRLTVVQPPGLRLEFFNVDELAARVLFLREPFQPGRDRPPRLLIAGGSPFARAVLIEAARQWRLRGAEVPGRLVVDYVADDARVALFVLRNRYPFLDQTVETTPYELPLPILLSAGLFSEPHDRAFVCYPDEEHGVKVALTTHSLWYSGCRSVLLPLDQLAGLTAAFHDPTSQPLLDEIHGALRPYPLVEAACDPALISEDLTERLARLIHEHYLAGCRRRGEPGAPASLMDWVDLDDTRRHANRMQASDIGAKLHTIGCILIPRVGVGTGFGFRDDELETLAEREHQRWKAEQEKQGWRFGERYDDALLRSPYLVDWARLPDAMRVKSRDAVQDMIVILADAGFDIVRVTDAATAAAI
jgi:hypothetical protein